MESSELVAAQRGGAAFVDGSIEEFADEGVGEI
jgi:hypothetical protein